MAPSSAVRRGHIAIGHLERRGRGSAYLLFFSSAMPHFGQLPGLSDFSSGCIGQLHVSGNLLHPPLLCHCIVGVSR